MKNNFEDDDQLDQEEIEMAAPREKESKKKAPGIVYDVR
jgi:hypothetical protein